jgi:hypothetical protein
MSNKTIWRFEKQGFEGQFGRQFFYEELTEENAKKLSISFSEAGAFLWSFKPATKEIMQYNAAVKSEEYKSEINKFKEIYKGVNLNSRVERLHKSLGIFQLGSREIFETIKL